VLVAGLGRADDVERDARARLLDHGAVEAAEGHAVGTHHRHLAVIEEGERARVLQQRGHVGGDEVLALTVSDDDPAGVGDARGDDGARIGRRHEHHGGGSLDTVDRGARGVGEGGAAPQAVLDEVDDDLRIGLAAEAMPVRHELVLQLAVVLDDAVVDNGRDAVAVEVRMRVRLARAAMCRPPRMADAQRAGRRPLHQHAVEIAELALGAAELEVPVDGDGDAGGVVAAILQPAQALHHDRHGVARSDVADDAAHQLSSSSAARASSSALEEATVELFAST
jgi:hypothetical protein